MAESTPRRFLLQHKSYNLTSMGAKRLEVGFFINSEGEFQPSVDLVDQAKNTRIQFIDSEYFLYMGEFHNIFTEFLDKKADEMPLKDMSGVKTTLKTIDEARGVEIEREGMSIIFQ